MEKLAYKLKTLSSLIVSPRANVAFYGELDEFTLDKIKENSLDDGKGNKITLAKDKLKVIYPFYQYGEYVAYAPDNAAYYLPGSSVKGALLQGDSVTGSFMADDVLISNEHIVLRNLYKAQYLKNEEQACFAVFFENVGVEMIKADVELKGEFYLSGKTAAKTLLEAANESTKVKIQQMLGYIGRLKTRGYSKEVLCNFNELSGRLSDLLKTNDTFLLGGYKGLLHTMKLESFPIENAGAVFFDPETMLPHGLVKIELT